MKHPYHCVLCGTQLNELCLGIIGCPSCDTQFIPTFNEEQSAFSLTWQPKVALTQHPNHSDAEGTVPLKVDLYQEIISTPIKERLAQAEPEHACKFCGLPSHIDPSDQSPPADICSEADHGEPELRPAAPGEG